MNDAFQFLGLRVLPVVVTSLEASYVLGLPRDWIPILVNAGLLRPCGGHQPGTTQVFKTAALQALAEDPTWADRAVAVVRKHFRKKNEARSNKASTKS